MVVGLPRKVRMFQKKWLVSPERKYVLSSWNDVFTWLCGDSGGQEATMEISNGMKKHH